MKLKEVEDGLIWVTQDDAFKIKKGLLPRGVPIYHLYNAEGKYVGQCKDLESDLSRAIGLAKTMAAKSTGSDD